MTGSSPRMRGSLIFRKPFIYGCGIIPAHAGLTDFAIVGQEIFWDHPRACGAHYVLRAVASASQGSSPRMRGSLNKESGEVDAFGIIPAHAGLTPNFLTLCTNPQDHPRACGAHLFVLTSFVLDRGSSPRMRGSQVPCFDQLANRGIIPAHAGLTRRGSST